MGLKIIGRYLFPSTPNRNKINSLLKSRSFYPYNNAKSHYHDLATNFIKNPALIPNKDWEKLKNVVFFNPDTDSVIPDKPIDYPVIILYNVITPTRTIRSDIDNVSDLKFLLDALIEAKVIFDDNKYIITMNPIPLGGQFRVGFPENQYNGGGLKGLKLGYVEVTILSLGLENYFTYRDLNGLSAETTQKVNAVLDKIRLAYSTLMISLFTNYDVDVSEVGREIQEILKGGK